MTGRYLTGGQILVECLIDKGIKDIFGIPGYQNDWFYNALFDYKEEIKVIHCRHEQGAAYMALGYNLASGKIGAFNVVPGPGFLNSTAALATAWGLNAKVLAIVGQIPLNKIGKGEGLLHETPDQLSIIQQFTKWSKRINSPEEIPSIFDKAIRELSSGRTRPVGLEIPMNVLKEKGNFLDFLDEKIQESQNSIDNNAVDEAVKLILSAKNPLVFVGGGALDSSESITEIVKHLQIPVFSYRTGKGIVSEHTNLSFPLPFAHKLWATTDLIIGIGTHLRMPFSKWGINPKTHFISINIDVNAHRIFRHPTIEITGDSNRVCNLILQKVAQQSSPKTPKDIFFEQFKKGIDSDLAYLEPQIEILKQIRQALPDDGILVDDLNQIGFASRVAFPVYFPRTYLSTGFMGTLGWGFQVAIGAKVAKPDVPVVSIMGDGGFLFGIQELATAVLHKIPVVVLVFNNGIFGNGQQKQRINYDNRVIATDLHNPDFVLLAQSFGAFGEKVEDYGKIGNALKLAFKRSLPTVIEIPIPKSMPSINKFKNLPKLFPQ